MCGDVLKGLREGQQDRVSTFLHLWAVQSSYSLTAGPCAHEENVSHLSGTKVSLEQAVPTAVGSEGQPP